MEKNINMEWDSYFLNIAEAIKLKSKDQSTQIGAVIVGTNNEIRSTGYNSFPRGLDDNKPERQERPQKYDWIEHAERNTIYNAARVGIPIDGSVMYLTSGLPCCDCARAIINSGIQKVYCKKVCTTKNHDKWAENQSRAYQMLQECGVYVEFYD